MTPAARAPRWDAWRSSTPYTVGIEEEIMLLDPADWSLAQHSEEILAALPDEVADRLSPETHQAAVEVGTEPHRTVGAAVAELAGVRAQLAAELEGMGRRAAVAGTHPTTLWTDTRVSPDERYQVIHDTMADIARREPTFALHVHVGVEDPHDAIRLMNRLREHLPMLLALSANSPFWQGRQTGLASTRIPIFAAFPRTGIPRRFASYEDWATSVGCLVNSGAIPEPTFLWWDLRPQPRFGTVEVRIMDAQTRVAHTGPLCALVQCLARYELEEGVETDPVPGAEEALAENRFLAVRDGIEAAFVDPAAGLRQPARDDLVNLLARLRPHADDLGCRLQLEGIGELASAPPFARQLAVAAEHGLPALIAQLAQAFDQPG